MSWDDDDRDREAKEREAALRSREAATERARSRPVSSVPTGRIPDKVSLEVVSGGRGDFEGLVRSATQREWDRELSRVLRLPRPEKPPPNVSKCDK